MDGRELDRLNCRLIDFVSCEKFTVLTDDDDDNLYRFMVFCFYLFPFYVSNVCACVLSTIDGL